MFIFLASTLIAVLVLAQALKLPPAIYEPLGPSTFPFWLSIALFALGFFELVAWLRRRRSADTPLEPQMAATEVDMPSRAAGMDRMWVPVAVGLATLAYVAALHRFEIGFPVATAVYVFAISAPFSSRKAPELVAMALGALLFGYANHYLFTEILFIDI